MKVHATYALGIRIESQEGRLPSNDELATYVRWLIQYGDNRPADRKAYTLELCQVRSSIVLA